MCDAGNELPWKEDEKVGYPLNPYGYTKLCNESQFMQVQYLQQLVYGSLLYTGLGVDQTWHSMILKIK